ncbi:type II toxin-antitoxin system Phd/YefM family antitoxin [Thomasclavelia cocleata]|jgi:antitoxin Phd|uniref:type II toxin-antitoxin system Phd/YefM family antitoxin n=1 Tax=Thomasclavelia cocleata TaxID=69824 RepID=UPI00255B19A2|nr:type II toxin-antitoxin system Phd/YefM family antitoxin [Thomasclavelia cocleata]
MIIDTNNIFSMKEANQNFSKITRYIDSNGKVIIYKHNKPKYIIIPYDEHEKKMINKEK